MKNKLYIGVGILLALGLSFGLGRYTSPTKTITVEKQSKSTDLTVTEREVKQKDGTIIKEVIKTNVVTVNKENTKLVESKKPQWKVSALSDIKANTFGVAIERRLLGNVFAGVQYFDNKAALSIGMEF